MQGVKNNRGFTLIELLLVIAIVGILTGLSVPAFRIFTERSDRESTKSLLVHSLEHAKLLAVSVTNDSSWGVFIDESAVTIFEGESYAGRNLDEEDVIELSQSITISGDQEIIFEKNTGRVDEDKSVNLSIGTETIDIEVNRKGFITVND